MATPVMTVNGDVVAVHSYWTDDQSRIVTESTIRTPDGDVVVSQLGGTVDGIGMITMPGPPLLVLGMTVAVAAHHDVDLEQQDHIVLDSVKLVALPPRYVRTGPTKAGHSLYWESGCIFVTADAAGTTALPGDTEFAIIDASINTWNTETDGSCSYLTVMADDRKAGEVGRDGVNLIKFRDTVWGRPASGKDPARVYDPSAAGLTTVIFYDDKTSARDGAIIDADIEINGVDFAISTSCQQGRPETCQSLHKGGVAAQLQNTLTHELGHMHGLEHTCSANPNDPPRLDNLMQPVPSCGAVMSQPLLPANMKILDATMFPFQDPGETKKETLSEDDKTAMCQIYPPSIDPGTCNHVNVDTGGCCSASGRDFQPGSLMLAAVVLTVVRRRKFR